MLESYPIAEARPSSSRETNGRIQTPRWPHGPPYHIIAPIMLTAFSLENYRAFPEKTTVELRPLTLLFGYNNVGKSSLIRALALMADSARSSGRGVLDLASEAARDCDFDDLLSRLSGSEKLRLGLTFEEGEQIEAEIAQALKGRRFVSDLRIARDPDPSGGPALVFAQWTPQGPYGSAPGYDVSVNGSSAGKMGLKFTSLAPRIDGGASYEGIAQEERGTAAEKAFLRAEGLVEAMGLHFQWLGSLRRYPPRYGRYLGEPPPRMAPDGAGAAEILAYDKLDGGALLTEVSGWYEQFFKRRMDVDQTSDKRFSVTLEPIEGSTKPQINIADTGEGMAQVLPVLVAAAMARRHGPWDPWTLAIEQPELHLHPAVHAPLAEHFCRIAAMGRAPRMLIETHSENFLLGVQIQIAKGDLPADKVLVYWVKQLDDGTSYVQQLKFAKDGNLAGFPEKVFNENLDLAGDLLEIRERTEK
jgi:predicted ATPase